jgi:hypothetical protein
LIRRELPFRVGLYDALGEDDEIEEWQRSHASRREEFSRRASSSRHLTTFQRRGRNPARVTVTSRWTAALDGKLLAAMRAWRQ